MGKKKNLWKKQGIIAAAIGAFALIFVALINPQLWKENSCEYIEKRLKFFRAELEVIQKGDVNPNQTYEHYVADSVRIEAEIFKLLKQKIEKKCD